MDQPAPTNQEPVVPQGAKINSKEIKRYKTLSMVLGILLVLSLVGAGVLGYRYMSELIETSYLKHDKAELNKQVASLEKRLSDSGGKNAPSDSQVTLTDSDQAQLAASAYYCLLKEFGCDKVASQIVKIQKPTLNTRGYALVKAIAGPTDNYLYLWVAHQSADSWVVVYSGKTNPPANIVTEFSIPADFVL